MLASDAQLLAMVVMPVAADKAAEAAFSAAEAALSAAGLKPSTRVRAAPCRLSETMWAATRRLPESIRMGAAAPRQPLRSMRATGGAKRVTLTKEVASGQAGKSRGRERKEREMPRADCDRMNAMQAKWAAAAPTPAAVLSARYAALRRHYP